MEQSYNDKVNDKTVLQIIIKTIKNTMGIKEIIFIDESTFIFEHSQ